MPTTTKQAILRPIRPNEGTKARYRRQMKAMIREMADNVEYWCEAWRKAHPPELAMDETPSQEIQREFAKLSQHWQARFEEMAPKVATQFLRDQFQGTDAAMRQALRDAGWSVEFVLTPAMHDAFEASLAENIGLIRSIASEYLQQVEGIVMRNYTAGRNVRAMAKEIHARFGVSSNRAMLISRDQSNKANAVVQRTRQKELGITEAIWLHSRAGKTPRPTHVAMDGKRYKVAKGMWDSEEKAWIFPGELINCRCVQRSVLPWSPVTSVERKHPWQSLQSQSATALASILH